MPTRLFRLPVIAALLAAIDVVCVRLEFDHRPAEFELFAQTFALWLVFVLLAWPVARVLRGLGRRVAGATNDAARSAADATAWTFCAAFPVLAHSRLDTYTNLYGRVGELKTAWPWLEVLAIAVGLVVLQRFVPRLVAKVGVATGGVALATLSVVSGTFVSFHEEAHAPSAVHASNGAAAKPNILVLVWDTTRAQNLSIYGYDRETTPNLARLASESRVFTNARSASRYTLTSHLSMLTGTYPSHHGARLLRQTYNPARTPSIARMLREAGYRTGGFVGTDVLRAKTGTAFAFERWDDQVDPPVCDSHAWALVHDVQSVSAKLVPALSNNGNPHWIQDYQRPASEVLAHAAEWIAADDPRPWFCFVNLYDVHWPYLPPADAAGRWVEPYQGIVDGYLDRSDRYPKGYKPNEADNRHLENLYDGEMWELDREVDAFLAKLELARSNTSVVMVSDHGEAFGEAGLYEHHDILECQVHIPFLVRPAGGAEPAGHVDFPVTNVDVAPTVLALAGLDAPEHMNGVDVMKEGALAPDREILVEDRDTGDPHEIRLALYSGGWKYEHRRRTVRGAVEEVERLFDLANDPGGLHDVAGAHPERVAALRERLAVLRGAWHADDSASGLSGPGNSDALKALGYLGDG
ncbi:MAG: sulfatase-like hydrolase/transferase [Planctomycetes bacterium]|nr:sulfatase-like hydrolase/transferase [Planctomycetota bacterium]